jgi:positive regulator of sigma E activity
MSAQSKGSTIRSAATNTFNNQLLIEDKRCQSKLGVKGGECKSLLITKVQMAHGTCRSSRGCGTDSAASFGKSTLSVLQVVKASALKWGRRQSRVLVRRNHAKKVLTGAVFKMAARYRPIF